MGYYDDYYKKYYSSIKGERRPNKINGYPRKNGLNKGGNFIIFLNIFDKRYVNICIGQLIVVTILILLLIGVKVFPNKYLQVFYQYTTKYIENGIMQGKDLKKEDVSEVFNIIEDFIKSSEKKIEEIRDNYLPPTEFIDNTTSYEKNGKFYVGITDNTTIKASNKGKVKSIDKGKNSIAITYGDGIEMNYGNLDSIFVKPGESLIKGDLIGQANKNENFYLEIYYMGEKLDPSKWLLK